jgi:hypothetical protein
LLTQLNTVLSHVDQFVTTAESTVAHYVNADNASANSMRHA